MTHYHFEIEYNCFHSDCFEENNNYDYYYYKIHKFLKRYFQYYPFLYY